MRFSLKAFRRSAALLAASLSFLCIGSFIPANAADSTPASTGGASIATSTGGERQVDISPSSSDRKINFPERSSVGNFFESPSAPPMFMPPPAYVPNQRTKRMLDNQRNWGFMTPEDVMQNYLSKEMMQTPDFGPDGRDRNNMTAIERYSDRQTRGRGMTNSASRDDSMSIGALWGDQSLNGGLSPFGEDSPRSPRGDAANFGGAAVRPEVLSELLGFRNNPMSPDAVREREAQEKQMDAFKQALNFQQPPVPASTIQNSTVATPDRTVSGWNNSIANNPANQRNPYDPVAGTYNAALATAAPIAPAAPYAPVAPGQANPYAPSLTPATPTRLGPPKAEFSVPQRRF